MYYIASLYINAYVSMTKGDTKGVIEGEMRPKKNSQFFFALVRTRRVAEGVIEGEMRVVSQPHHVITGISKGDTKGDSQVS